MHLMILLSQLLQCFQFMVDFFVCNLIVRLYVVELLYFTRFPVGRSFFQSVWWEQTPFPSLKNQHCSSQSF